jgi:hypothetical protein
MNFVVFVPVDVYEQELAEAIFSLLRYVGPSPVGGVGVVGCRRGCQIFLSIILRYTIIICHTIHVISCFAFFSVPLGC